MPALTGMAVGLDQLEGLLFDPHKPFVYCGICGAVYQTDINRKPHDFVNASFDYNFAIVVHYANAKLKEWSHTHAGIHTQAAHNALKLSGEHCTPEAALRLAAYGVIPLTTDSEINDALKESNPIPTDDAEGS